MGEPIFAMIVPLGGSGPIDPGFGNRPIHHPGHPDHGPLFRPAGPSGHHRPPGSWGGLRSIPVGVVAGIRIRVVGRSIIPGHPSHGLPEPAGAPQPAANPRYDRQRTSSRRGSRDRQ